MNPRRCVTRTICSVTLLLCFTVPIGAQTSGASDETSPASVVQNYCKLDLDGARLSSQNPQSDKIASLATWPIEPAWDTSVVVSNCQTISTSLGLKRSSVTVRYLLLGSMFGAQITRSQKRKELVKFVLTKSRDGWLIEHPLIAPHISVSAAISALNSLLINENDPEQIKRLQAGVDLLTKWKTEAGKTQ